MEVASDSGTSAMDSLDEQKRLAIAAIQRDLHASSMRAMAHGAAALFSSGSLSDVKQEPTEWDDLDDDNDSDEDVMILPEEVVKSKPAADGKPKQSPQTSQAVPDHYSLQQQQQQQSLPQPQPGQGQVPRCPDKRRSTVFRFRNLVRLRNLFRFLNLFRFWSRY